jgi:hypothetical protein
MHQNRHLEDGLLNYSARIIREEKSGLNPLALLAFDVGSWTLNVDRPEIGWYWVMKNPK